MAIEVFDNPYPERDYQVTLRWPESEDFDVHSKTFLPGILFIEYIPDRYCLNRESLVYYLSKFEETDFLDSAILNRLLSDLVNSCKPRQMDITYAPESDRSSITSLKRSYRKTNLRLEE